MSELLEFQRQFQRALIDTAANAAPGLMVHKTTIELGLEQTLAKAFPALHRVVGTPTFKNLAANFIAETPPRHPVLSMYGRDFPVYAAAQPIGASLPYLHDLARLEWARHEAALAADAPVLDAALLDTGNADAMSALHLRLHPAARVITSPFPIHRIWRLNQADVAANDIPTVDMKIAEHVLVTRPAGEVVTRAISLADATLLRAVMNGAHLGAAVEAAFALGADFDVTQALAGHFAGGTFQNL